uniref:Serine protease inhibitor 006 n=1 Tax=Chilo suppressalis TaxID=168631 RepID=J7HF01_CHISP|nr:serine protease inhibitor 006 [Chilo suppressalis]
MRIVLFLFCLVTSCYCDVEFSERPRNFSIELVHYTQLAKNGHVVISPFGIWTLMTGVALGATGESYNQLAHAFLLPKDRNALIKGYRDLTSDVLNPTTKGVTLSSTNFVFLDNDFKVFPEFSRTLVSDFKATVDVLDFQNPNSAEMANNKIQRTSGNVKNVLRSDDFAELRMILANVISFRGLWAMPFNKSNTKEEVFYNKPKNPIGRVNMMNQKSIFPFSNVRAMKCFALELPYGDDKKYAMLFLLPYQGVKVTEAYQNLANVSLKDIFKQLEEDVEEFGDEEIDVKIPRFHITTNVVMNKPLNNMGVYDIFQPDKAKFDRITNEDIFVSAIVHKADIEVSEAGTVASATTEAYFADRISPPSFYANRPFIYFLMEKTTMTMIFGGIFSKPTLF